MLEYLGVGVNFSPRNKSVVMAGVSDMDEKLIIFISFSRDGIGASTKKDQDSDAVEGLMRILVSCDVAAVAVDAVVLDVERIHFLSDSSDFYCGIGC